MAALNKDETQNLQDVVALLEFIQSHGYTPEQSFSDVGIDASIRRGIEESKGKLRSLRTRKGYHSNS